MLLINIELKINFLPMILAPEVELRQIVVKGQPRPKKSYLNKKAGCGYVHLSCQLRGREVGVSRMAS
jgi:hypothetical protein